MHSHADKSSIMSMHMKRGVLLLFLSILILAGLYAGDAWREDADRGNDYFQAGDYDAAWLFYQRALSKGCDDGMAVFQAAESFRLQMLPDNPKVETPEFESSLYAVARYFLESQYPDSSELNETSKFISEETVVNRRFLKQTYAVVGGKAPKMISGSSQFLSSGVGSVSGFFITRVEDLGELVYVMSSGDIRGALSWVKENLWSLLFSILIINSLTGIILPVVMAVTVAREGRKSYVTAYAFLLHWGMLGIHRFYLGRYVSGIIWLLTGGLFGIGVFFDIFLTGAYIRFWNEDHREERPVNRSSYTGKVKAAKVPRSPKPPKAPKPPKKDKKSEKSEKVPEFPVEVDKSEEFSFGAVAAGAAAVETLDDDALSVAAPPEPESNLDLESDFGDLPDLSFDDEGSDDLGEELSDEDFDIKSFE